MMQYTTSIANLYDNHGSIKASHKVITSLLAPASFLHATPQRG